MEYEPVIGLEVHAQLLTNSKIFCSCSTAFGAPPNSNTCPVCLGLPGALPVLNREAVAMAIKASLALNCRINQNSIFARKNYFYPDLPKGYQISQYDRPLSEKGQVRLLIPLLDEASGETTYEEKTFRINRLHMEDDAGKSVHVPDGDTLVNLNRTGVPLVEIVTEADFRSSQEAYEFVSYLRRVLLYLEVCDGNMEEGSLRCDANVSLRKWGTEKFGTKAEIKNLNSFRFMKKALDYEILRQTEVLNSGGRVVQETRLWDENAQRTETMRGKEEAHDYRYFPDPDLMPIQVSSEWLEELRSEIPELPEARRLRLVEAYGLPQEPAEIIVQTRPFADFFESAVAECQQPAAVCNWMVGDLMRHLKRSNQNIEDCPVSASALGRLVRIVEEGVISGKTAKDVFSEMYDSGKDAETIIAEKGLKQISNVDALESIVERVVQSNPDKVQAYRGGKEGLIGFFVGQVMRETKGQANPQMVNELLRDRLGQVE